MLTAAAAADVVYRIKKEFCANKSSRLLSEEEKNNLKFKATTRHDKKKCAQTYIINSSLYRCFHLMSRSVL
jgi:hypothetical protein